MTPIAALAERTPSAEIPSPAQIAASRLIMGIDTQLIDDGTYFVIEAEGRTERIAGSHLSRADVGKVGIGDEGFSAHLEPRRRCFSAQPERNTQ